MQKLEANSPAQKYDCFPPIFLQRRCYGGKVEVLIVFAFRAPANIKRSGSNVDKLLAWCRFKLRDYEVNYVLRKKLPLYGQIIDIE